MTQHPRVDVHAHLAPGDIAPELAGHPALRDPDALLSFLVSAGLDEALVSVPPGYHRNGLADADAASWVARINDALIEVCAIDRRLRPLAYLPLDHPPIAIAEVERLRHRPELAGWTATAGGGVLPLDSDSLRPVWSALASVDALVLLHPGESPDERLRPHYLANLLGNPVETGVAVAQLVFGGVVASHPRVAFVVVHCGGVVPAVASRWERGVSTARPGVDTTLSVGDELRMMWSDTLSHDPRMIDLAARVFGIDHLLLGSDWPFAMGTDDPLGAISHLSAADQDAVARHNPHRLRARRGAVRTATGHEEGTDT